MDQEAQPEMQMELAGASPDQGGGRDGPCLRWDQYHEKDPTDG